MVGNGKSYISRIVVVRIKGWHQWGGGCCYLIGTINWLGETDSYYFTLPPRLGGLTKYGVGGGKNVSWYTLQGIKINIG